jgi:hypothetical protein
MAVPWPDRTPFPEPERPAIAANGLTILGIAPPVAAKTRECRIQLFRWADPERTPIETLYTTAPRPAWTAVSAGSSGIRIVCGEGWNGTDGFNGPSEAWTTTTPAVIRDGQKTAWFALGAGLEGSGLPIRSIRPKP